MVPSIHNSFVTMNSIFGTWQRTAGSRGQQSWAGLEAVQDSKTKKSYFGGKTMSICFNPRLGPSHWCCWSDFFVRLWCKSQPWAPRRKAPSCSMASHPWGCTWVIFCWVTNYHEFSGLKQQQTYYLMVSMLQEACEAYLESSAWGFTRLKSRCPQDCNLFWSLEFFTKLTSCWQNLVPCDCRT